MAHINRLLIWRHLRAEPNQYILHYKNGKLRRSGPGVAYWFHPLAAAVAQVPVEDIETIFLLRERSADFQDVTVQAALTYRVVDPAKAAQRVNFAISLENGAWTEQPLERLARIWSQWAQQPVRAVLTAMPVVEAMQLGARRVHEALETALRDHVEAAAMGLAVVSVQVDHVSPTAELEKALQTPTREVIQQKADEATFQRRALAVEKERAIKENELATQIELTRRQENLIRQEGTNQMLAIQQETERQRFAVEAEAERQEIAARGNAEETRIRAEAEVEARRQHVQVDTDAEARRVELWRDAPSAVILGLAVQRFADKVKTIEHLNLTPDLLGDTLQRLLLERSE
ncbi:MAG: band 7 protein [Chloroflexi bacterium]|nr:band 7 protein [Chloroflexota bacterium]MBU1752196.1 band 7 protein [Chloroflexota bacterium]